MDFSLVHVPFYALLFVSFCLFAIYLPKARTDHSKEKLFRILTAVSIIVLTFVSAFINTTFDIVTLLMIAAIVMLLVLELLPRSFVDNHRVGVETLFMSISLAFVFTGVILITGIGYLALVMGILFPFIVWFSLVFFKIEPSKGDLFLFMIQALFAGLCLGQTLFMLATIHFSAAAVLLAIASVAALSYIFVNAFFYYTEKEWLRFPSFSLLYIFQILIILAIFII